MAFEATIIKDSVFRNGVRVTTARLSFPRSILAEFNTHRMFSRNAASSRAIPVAKMIAKIEEDPFIPEFKKNAKGMQGVEPLDQTERRQAKVYWAQAARNMVSASNVLSDKNGLNIHKQYTNRLLEPWMWATVIVTATDWNNMFAQRVHPAAEPSFQRVASMFYEAYKESIPQERWHDGDPDPECSLNWHLPFFDYSDEDRHQLEGLEYNHVYKHLTDVLGEPFLERANLVYPIRRFADRVCQDIAVGRLTKVSYENLDTGKIDVLNDIRLAVQLSMSHPGHWSPFEHVCREAKPQEMVYRLDQLTYRSYGSSVVPKEGAVGYCGNFRGTFQYRKEFSNENITEFEL